MGYIQMRLEWSPLAYLLTYKFLSVQVGFRRVRRDCWRSNVERGQSQNEHTYVGMAFLRALVTLRCILGAHKLCYESDQTIK